MEKEKFKHKPGTGTLFWNEKSNEKQPDIKGTIVLPDGTEYRLSGWKKAGNRGEFFSMAIDTYNGGGSSQTSTSSNNLPF